MLAALAARRAVPGRVAMVVAHPDDETIGAGGSLHLMPGLLLVHVTGGAPRAVADAARAGFASREAYAAAREAELAAALAMAGVVPTRVAMGETDQEVVPRLRAVAGRLRVLFREHAVTAVLTHAYEGGHPDHDAVACAVHAASGVPVYEFAGYRAGTDGSMQAQRFLSGPAETRVVLSMAEAGTKRAMLACFRSQAATLAPFGAAVERFRPAPRYDFGRAPHTGGAELRELGVRDERRALA